MHLAGPSRKPDSHVTNLFAHESIPSLGGLVMIKATCVNCGATFTTEISWLLEKERAHAKRCNVVRFPRAADGGEAA